MQSPHLLWQHPAWPALRYDGSRVGAAVANARRAQGIVEGKLGALGLVERRQLAVDAWTQEAMSTSAIEGEQLDLMAVRSSVARRLGAAEGKGASAPRHVDGLLDIMDDAVSNATAPLTDERLQGWQAALFPTGYSGMSKLLVGAYRVHSEPMQIVSGRHGREQVHYEAPPSAQVANEMQHFIEWFNATPGDESLTKAALAHLWFETIHPFEDGNGRVGRVIVDLLLAREAGEASRVIRFSQRLLEKRDDYYAQLEAAQHGELDVTPWMLWFVAQIGVACEEASGMIEQAYAKSRFWVAHRDKDLSARQRKAVNALLDAGPEGFEGGMNNRKYASLTSASKATSTRDLAELVELGLLEATGGGRSTRYQVRQ